MTPEAKIKALVKKGLAWIERDHPGKIAARMPVSRGMGKPWLDFVLCVRGRYVLIETKRDANHPLTLQQKITKAEFEDAGAVVFLVYDRVTCLVAIMALEKIITDPEQFYVYYHNRSSDEC